MQEVVDIAARTYVDTKYRDKPQEWRDRIIEAAVGGAIGGGTIQGAVNAVFGDNVDASNVTPPPVDDSTIEIPTSVPRPPESPTPPATPILQIFLMPHHLLRRLHLRQLRRVLLLLRILLLRDQRKNYNPLMKLM